MTGRIVIVGASATGVATAESLQQLAPDREVVLVGDEPTLAHERPPLSKQVLEGSWAPEQADLLPPSRRERFRARLMLGRRATGVDIHRRALRIDDGSIVEYTDLVVATGVRPRMIPGPRPRGVYVLRNLADCQALRRAMDAARDRRMVVVGGGFIGLEVAATARKLGVAVTVVEPDPSRLTARLGRLAADRLLDVHLHQGVDFRLKVGIVRFGVDSADNVCELHLTDGSSIAASVVLVAIGCTPNVEWLMDSGLDVSDGVQCDEFCRAAPGVWAAGDVARWKHVGLDRRIRVEHRLNASEQGAAVAANIVGPLRPYTPTPFFWTDQYDVKLQLAGVPPECADETVERLSEDSYLHTFHAKGSLVAVLGWNAAKAMMPLRRQLARSDTSLRV